MKGPLSEISLALEEMIDGSADLQADVLRRVAGWMSEGYDQAAQRDVEGARDWRNLTTKEERYASAHS